MNNQHITRATDTIQVSVVDHRLLGGAPSSLAESAILIAQPDGTEKIIGVQVHGRKSKDGRRMRTNRAIACQIARQIRRREAGKNALK